MAVKSAAALLDAFRAAGIAVEVTRRSKRRLFRAQRPKRRCVMPCGRRTGPTRHAAAAVRDSISPTIRLIAWRRCCRRPH